MAKDVKFNIRLTVDGKEQLVAASADSKELARQLGIGQEKAVKFCKALLNFNLAADAVQRVSDVASGLAGHMRDVLQANTQVSQLTGKTGDEMLELRNGVQAVADYFGLDFAETLRAVNNLSKGFGIDAGAALKLLRDGLVSGANANGEFLDTLREYPRYFKEAGLSAEAFVAISTSAARQGIYSDKGVDAIKEGNLRIREMTAATAAALEGIGISAAGVQQSLQDGSLTTFEVMQMVAARLKELPPSAAAVGTAIADIFGGPGEDAGLEYIKTLADVELSMDRVKEAAGETAAQQEKVIRTQEGLRNGLSRLVDLSGLYAKAQPFVELAAQAGMATTGIATLLGLMKDVNWQAVAYRARMMAAKAASLLFGQSATGAAGDTQMLAASATGASRAMIALRASIRAAFIASGVGIAIWAVTEALNALVSSADEAADSVDRLDTGEGEFSAAAAQAKVEIDKEIRSLGELIRTKGDASGAVQRLNDTYGESFGTYSTAAEWYDVLTRKSRLYVKQVGYEAQAKSLAAKMAEREADIAMNADKQQELKDSGQAYKQKSWLVAGFAPRQYQWEETEAMRALREESEALNAELSELSKRNDFVLGQMEKLAGQLKTDPAAGIRGDEVHIVSATPTAASVGAVGEEADISREKVQALAAELRGILGIGGRQSGAGLPEPVAASMPQGAGLPTEREVPGMSGLPYKPVQDYGDALEAAREKAEAFRSGLTGVGSAISSITGLAGEGAQQWGQWAEGLLNAVAQALPAILTLTHAAKEEANANAQGAVAKGMNSVAGVPFAGPALAVAAAASIVAALASIPKFAQGGIAYGPTLGLFGEYPGASGNPEVVAPLDRLRSLIQPVPQLAGDVKFRIEGRDLVGIYAREQKISKRS